MFLTARWRDLILLNYEIDPAALAPRVPPGTELDSWRGSTYVSLVGFLFQGTRVLGVPVPFHRDFEEVNLRFYVRRRAPEGWRRGVVFVKELVPRRAIAFVARRVYGENYEYVPMRRTGDAHLHDPQVPLREARSAGAAGIPTGSGSRSISYEWRHAGRWSAMGARVSGEPRLPDPDSEETFLTEHHWGYSVRPDGSCLEYHVAHPPWRVWQAEEPRVLLASDTLYAPSFSECLRASQPRSGFVAEGSPVAVHRGRVV